MRDEVTKKGINPSRENCWQYFVSRCADNLHVVLNMSPVGDKLRERCRNFPGLVNNTVIDWFLPWPEQALTAVATVFLGGGESAMIPPEHYDQVVKHFVHVHQAVTEYSKSFQATLRRVNFVTPKNYLNFIGTYLKLLAEKDSFVLAQCDRLGGGMTKLVEASKDLGIMNEQLAVQKVTLAESTAACAVLLDEISVATAEATEKQSAAAAAAKQIAEDNITIQAEKKEAEDALAVALPALEEAKQALDSLEKSDVTEIRSFAKPPPAVQTVCECLIIMKNYGGGKDLGWNAAKVGSDA